MLRYVDVITNKKTQETHRQYTINQGDTFTLYIKDNIDNIEESKIASAKFKLGKSDYSTIYEQQYIYDADNQRWICKFDSTTTNLWEVNIDGEPYNYEIEITYTDGNSVSVELYEFYVDYQIGEE